MKIHKKIIQHSQDLLRSAKKKINESQKQEEEKNKMYSDIKLSPIFKSDESSPRSTIDISLISALKIIAVIFGVLLVGKAISETATIIITFFLALFLSSTLFPAVEFFEKKKIPRGLSIGIVYVLLIGFLLFIISTLVPALLAQIIALGEWIISILKQIVDGDFSVLPEFLQKYGPQIKHGLQGLDSYVISLGHDTEAQKGLFQILKDNVSKVQSWGGSLTEAFAEIISFFIQVVMVLLLTFFILYDREKIKSFFLSFFAPRVQKYVDDKGKQMHQKISSWMHGQMILFVFMGGVTWIFLSILGIEYALTLGFLAGIAEFIPYLGPIIAFSLTAPIAFGHSFEAGVAVVIFFIILQMVEGNVLVPMVMDKAMGVPPIVTIVAMLIGFSFLGIIGAILAIPVASIIGIFLFDIRKAEEKSFFSASRKKE